jgi:hypothetical protein
LFFLLPFDPNIFRLQLRYDKMSVDVFALRDKLEDQSFAVSESADAEGLRLWDGGKGEKQAVQHLTNAANKNAEDMVNAWWDLVWKMMAKWSNNYQLTGEGDTDWIELGYPDWWLALTEFVSYPNVLPPPLKSASCTEPSSESPSSSNPSPISEWKLELSRDQVALIAIGVGFSWMLVGYLSVRHWS